MLLAAAQLVFNNTLCSMKIYINTKLLCKFSMLQNVCRFALLSIEGT